METADHRLASAVRFANMELNRFSPGDWLKLKEDLTVFLNLTQDDFGAAAPWVVISGILDPQHWTEEGIRELQPKAKQMLALAADPAETWGQITIKDRVELKIQIFMKYVGKQVVFNFHGSPPDLYLVALQYLLALRPSIGRIRRCPECSKLFLKVKKQLYCSRACVNRVNMRDWRKEQEAKAQERKPQGRKRARAKAA